MRICDPCSDLILFPFIFNSGGIVYLHFFNISYRLLVLLIQYGIQFWHELAYTLLHSLKLNLNICGTSACFSLTFDLHCYLNCTSGTYLPGSNINRNKINQNTDHISAFTQPPLPSCLHTNICMQNLMISVVSTQICHPSNQASIK